MHNLSKISLKLWDSLKAFGQLIENFFGKFLKV